MLVPWVDVDRAFSQAEALHRQVDAMLGAQSALRNRASVGGPRWSEDETGYALSVDLPGLGRDDVELTVTNRHLSLKASRQLEWPEDTHVRHRERRSWSVDRTWTLPVTADVENANASFTDGVLTVQIPKNPQATARRIEVQHG